MSGEGVFRALLRLYPRTFREAYGPEMLDAFRSQRAEPRYRGARGHMRLWLEIGSDLAVNLVRQWSRRARTDAGDGEARIGLDAKRKWGREAMVDGFKQDLGYALRTLRRSPGFATVAVLTLALGIGANAAIFGVVNGVLLRPLPYGDPDGVATVWSSWVGFPKTWVSQAEYQNYAQENRTFEDMALWYETNAAFTDPQSPERVRAAGVTENLLAVLEVQPAVGRWFSVEETLATDTLPSDVVVIAYETWQRRFAGDPGIVGNSVQVNGRARTLIGVLPPGFRLPTGFEAQSPTELYFPYWVDRQARVDFPQRGGSHGFHVVGRLRAGFSADDAQRDLDNIVGRLKAEGLYPESQQFAALVYSAADDVLGQVRPALIVLLAAVGFVLLIACANVANLLLTRSRRRQQELAVRTALGAARKRLVRQLLTESVVLATLGGALGLVVAYAGTEALMALEPGNLPRLELVTLDGTVLLFAGLLTLMTAFLFGTLPALRTARGDLRVSLTERTAGGTGRGHRQGWQGILVSAEMALAVVLVMGAGLMVRTFVELTSLDPGFRGDRVLTMGISLPQASYPDAEDTNAFFSELIRRIGELPGVEIASATRILPLASQIGDWGLRIEAYERAEGESTPGDWQIAAPGYVEAMGIELVSGRTFTELDDADALPVAMVNEAFVRRYFGGRDPIGQRFQMGGSGDTPPVTIVGVVGDLRHNGVTVEIKQKFYIPLQQWHVASGGPRRAMTLVVKTAGDPGALVRPVQEQVRGMDPTLPLSNVRTVADILRDSVAQPRFTTVLLGLFSAVAVLLAVVGIWGVIAYGVSQRTQEIGIRLALGAERGQVVGMMLRRGMAMAGLGVVVGVVASLALTRFLSSLLYGVEVQDPATFLIVVLGFAGVAAAATWLPARRAARVDPMQALRYE